MPSLHSLAINELKDEGIIIVCNALKDSKVSKLKELVLEINGITATGAASVAEYLAISASLTSVNLLSNQLDAESVTMLLKIKAEKSNLRTLCGLTHKETNINLFHKGLGSADAMLLASDIAVMAELTKIE